MKPSENENAEPQMQAVRQHLLDVISYWLAWAKRKPKVLSPGDPGYNEARIKKALAKPDPWGTWEEMYKEDCQKVRFFASPEHLKHLVSDNHQYDLDPDWIEGFCNHLTTLYGKSE
jgi:hypothetical protein